MFQRVSVKICKNILLFLDSLHSPESICTERTGYRKQLHLVHTGCMLLQLCDDAIQCALLHTCSLI